MKKRKKEKERKKKRESPPCVCKSAGKREITLKNTIFYLQKSKDEKNNKSIYRNIMIACVRMCVGEREGERERERVKVCVYECVCVRDCVCVSKYIENEMVSRNY